MITTFPMYKRPELVDAHNTYYTLIRTQLSERGIDSPAQISADPENIYHAWESPDLFLSQTCGLPYRVTLHGKVQLIGTPDYQLDGCQPGHYRSAVVVRREDENKALPDFKDSVFTFNSKDSQSGYGNAYQLCQKHGFWFENRVPSGGHRESGFAIAQGLADIAFIDAHTWRMLQSHETYTKQLTVIDWSAATPGTPYITSMNNDADKMFAAINAAIDELPADARNQLGIYSLAKISAEDYLAVDNPPV